MNESSPARRLDAIVRIFNANGFYAGNGFFVDDEGAILTTLYVARDEKKFTVVAANDHRTTAMLARVDGITELALLRTSAPWGQSSLRVRNVNELPADERVAIIGYAGNTLSTLAAQAAGTYRYDNLSPDKTLLRVDRPPRGLSGAPAIDRAGEVVGVLIAYLPDRSSAVMVSGATVLTFLHPREGS